MWAEKRGNKIIEHDTSKVIRLDIMLKGVDWFEALDDEDKALCIRSLSWDIQAGFRTGNWRHMETTLEAWQQKARTLAINKIRR